MKISKTISARLRHRLTLEQEIKTPDGAGGYTKTWESVADIWAEIQPISGKERVFAGQISAEISHKITIRYRVGLNTAMRFVYNDRIFNISAILNPEEIGKTLEIWVSEEN